MLHPAQRFSWCTLHISVINRVTIYSLYILFSLFGTSPLFHVQFCCFLTCTQISQEAGQAFLFDAFLQFFTLLMLIVWPRFYLELFTLRGESKLAKMACSGSLTPRFSNNGDGTTEIICSTVHACVTRYSLDYGTLCGMHICELHLEGSSSLLLHHAYVHWDSH